MGYWYLQNRNTVTWLVARLHRNDETTTLKHYKVRLMSLTSLGHGIYVDVALTNTTHLNVASDQEDNPFGLVDRTSFSQLERPHCYPSKITHPSLQFDKKSQVIYLPSEIIWFSTSDSQRIQSHQSIVRTSIPAANTVVS